MRPNIIVISLIAFFIIMIGSAFIITSKQELQPTTMVFSAQDKDRPKAETARTSFNMGEIKVSDVKRQDYSLKNTGTKPLQILNVNSSCGCTAGQIIYNGKTSKEYSMHSQSGLVTEIAPGDTAIVRLTYRPATMPVYGLVERAVYVTTNDPVNQKLVFSITAKVR